MRTLFVVGFLLAVFLLYYFIRKRNMKTEKQKTGFRKELFVFSGLLTCVFILFLIGAFFTSYRDIQCTKNKNATSDWQKEDLSSVEYFNLGNIAYDNHNCVQAITDYTAAILKDPIYFRAYNNRGYTYMRLHNYAAALMDMNVAIQLRPGYPQAIMNRGDLFNYYGPIIDRQKAIADYTQVIAMGYARGTSVCGHLAMAKTNNVIPLAFLNLFMTHSIPGC